MAQEAICYSGQMQRIQISSGRCTAAICFVRCASLHDAVAQVPSGLSVMRTH
ncbi:Uncharacterized protein APZ42_024399 [Daphnia magna]|uniref:Uncharacterized protein n=1 Tax=Daphnia magna TaxID=35525 RepID=A0A164U2F2_9CRUS|nr:Uncharacterized protein APZ42_024399 [Daphnia magna]